MSLKRKIQRSKNSRVHLPPRACALVITAKDDNVQLTIRGPAQPRTSGPERETDRALRSLAQEAMEYLRKVLTEIKVEDTPTNEHHDDAREEADGAGSPVHQG